MLRYSLPCPGSQRQAVRPDPMLPAWIISQDSACALDTSLKSSGAYAHSAVLDPPCAARQLIQHSDPAGSRPRLRQDSHTWSTSDRVPCSKLTRVRLSEPGRNSDSRRERLFHHPRTHCCSAAHPARTPVKLGEVSRSAVVVLW